MKKDNFAKTAAVLRDTHFWIPTIMLLLGLLLLFWVAQQGGAS